MVIPANDNPARLATLRSLALFVGATSGHWRNVLALFFGVCATLTLPPFFLLPFLPVAFCGLYWLVIAAPNARRAAYDGWWFGFGMFAVGLYWIANALLVDADQFGWLVPFAALGIPAVLGLLTALTMMCFYRMRGTAGGFRSLWMFALFWLGGEWVRGHVLTGFPWNLSGYAWSFSETTLQLYSFFGVYITGFFTVLLALVPALLASQARHSRKMACAMSALFLAVLGAGYMRVAHAPRENVPGVMLRIVQPSIAQKLKWDPEYLMEGLQKTAKLSLSAGKEQVTHMIWPESAMPFPFVSGDIWAHRLAEMTPPGGALLTGVTRMRGSPEAHNLRIFNSLQAVDSRGEVVMTYDKVKLVPFGEFVPFRSFLPIEKITHGTMDFSPGKPGKNYKVLGLPPLRPLICYESIFPALSDGAYPAWLLNVTNDAWFGDSSGPRQHLEMARARAVEQGVPLVRAANTGISAVVDAYGRILKQLPLNVTGVIDSPLPQPAIQPTIFTLYGKYLTILLGLFSAILFYIEGKPD